MVMFSEHTIRLQLPRRRVLHVLSRRGRSCSVEGAQGKKKVGGKNETLRC